MYANQANLAAVDHLGRKLPDFNECPPTKKRLSRSSITYGMDTTEHKAPMTSQRSSKPIYNGPPKSLHPFTINRERGIIKPKEQKNHDTKDIHSGI